MPEPGRAADRLIASSKPAGTDLLAGAAWQCGAARPAPTTNTDPSAAGALEWIPVSIPGTAAGALAAAGRTHGDLDSEDWWFRTTVVGEAGAARLLVGGIATIADVWLNGEHLLHSENMFRSHDLDATLKDGENELLLRCAALNPRLTERRPRPRWKSYLVSRQNLRWFRTTLLGRIPGWAVTPPAVGPWRPMRLLPAHTHVPQDWHLAARCDGDGGVIDVTLRLRGQVQTGTAATVHAAGQTVVLNSAPDADEAVLRGQLRLSTVERWWPHTHGAQPLYAVEVEIDGDRWLLGQVGFRTVEVDRSNDGFAVIVNGERIFARGACWMPADPVRLACDAETQRRWVQLAREANMNMIRVPGTTVYPDSDFYEACDQLGVLVWQDCMFAFLDPPLGDQRFDDEVDAELTQVFATLAGHPSLAIVCGNQEVEEIAAMNGLVPQQWATELAEVTIPALLTRLLPGVPYVSSNPTGGALPFQMNAGVSQYFGVGGYMRPLDDARRAGVRFASECLALATPPEPNTVEQHCGGACGSGHDPQWKQAVHHDSGRSWDMEDVRDFYVRTLFGVDPLHERYVDPERALDLGRATNAELMSSVFSEWRRPGSSCDGGLALALGDLRPGAGWGVVDAFERPKAPWYALRRTFAPVAMLLTDEGLNGLDLHLFNDLPQRFRGRVEVELFARGETPVGAGQQEVGLPARGAVTIEAGALLGGFRDISYAYRFSPPTHDLVVATLYDTAGQLISRVVHLPLGQQRSLEADLGLRAALVQREDGDAWQITVCTRRFAQWVSVDVPGFIAEDSWFHLPPGASQTVALRRDPAAAIGSQEAPSHGSVRALNLDGSVQVEIPEDGR